MRSLGHTGKQSTNSNRRKARRIATLNARKAAAPPAMPVKASRRVAPTASFLSGESTLDGVQEVATSDVEAAVLGNTLTDAERQKRHTLPGTTLTARDAVIWGEILQRRF